MFNEKYFCVDSVPQNYTDKLNEGMLYVRWDKAKLEALKSGGNLRYDCGLIIMEKRLQWISDEERIRLTTFKTKLEQVIQLNSDMRNLTTSNDEKIERNRENNYNRGKLAIVTAMLN